MKHEQNAAAQAKRRDELTQTLRGLSNAYQKCAALAQNSLIAAAAECFEKQMSEFFAHETFFDAYECLSRLYGQYAEFSRKFAELGPDAAPPDVFGILSGVTAVLESRVNYFSDITKNEQNPVANEKNAIIEKHASELKNAVREKNLSGGFANQTAAGYLSRNGQNEMSVRDFVLEAFLQNEFSDCFELFANARAKLREALNSADNRPKARFFYDLLINEHNELSNIAVKQIWLVENAVLAAAQAANARAAGVGGIIKYFRNIYQNAQGFSDEAKNGFASAKEPAEAPNRGDIIRTISEKYAEGGACAKYKKSEAEFSEALKKAASAFKTAVKHAALRKISETGFLHCKYLVNKAAAEHKALSEGLKELFARVPAYFETRADALMGDPDFEIISGICETVKIKLLCLNDNEGYLNDMASEILNEAKHIPDLTEACLRAAFAGALALAPDYDLDFAGIITAPDLEAFFAERKKKHDAVIERLLKKSARYKKDCLLVEISTFEEVITYSVSRLKNSEFPETLEFAALCEGVYADCVTMLSRNNITPIKPEPRAMFNAKEHEVLSAEKNADYAKGEIIRLVNSGFKQDGVVLMRANVIAAK